MERSEHPLRRVTQEQISKDILSVRLLDEEIDNFEMINLLTIEEIKGFQPLIDLWLDGSISTHRLQQCADQYYNFTTKLSKNKEVNITKGVMCLLVSESISGQSSSISNQVSDVLSYLIELEKNQHPARQIRRYRKNVENLLCHVAELCCKSQADINTTSAYLFGLTKRFVSRAQELLCRKSRQITSLFDTNAKAVIQKICKGLDELRIKHISNMICGQFYAGYCPQP